VVKYGGHAMGEEHLAAMFGSDIALLKQVGINPVVVHGGGPQINKMLDKLEVHALEFAELVQQMFEAGEDVRLTKEGIEQKIAEYKTDKDSPTT
jgi:acetylglutamate kinase